MDRLMFMVLDGAVGCSTRATRMLLLVSSQEFLPTGFVVIIRLAAVRCGASVRFFLAYMRRDFSQLLSWQTWDAANNAVAGDAAGCASPTMIATGCARQVAV